MALTAAAILNHHPSSSSSFAQQNGVDKTLTFVSGGFCKFSVPDGCVSFDSFKQNGSRSAFDLFKQNGTRTPSSDSFKLNGSRASLSDSFKLNGTSTSDSFKLNGTRASPSDSFKQNGTRASPSELFKLNGTRASPSESFKLNGTRALLSDSFKHNSIRIPTQRPLVDYPLTPDSTSGGNDSVYGTPNSHRQVDLTSYRPSDSGDARSQTPVFSKKRPLSALNDGSPNELYRTSKRPRYSENGFQYHWNGLDVAKMASHACGFFNSRNDCFMNSVLQFVLHTPQLIRYITAKKDKHKCVQDPSNNRKCIYCVLGMYIDRICKKINSIDPLSMRSIVNAQFPGRIPDNQEDAHEMLIFLLSKLEPPLPKRSDQNTPKVAQTTEIDRIFGGKISSKISCKHCDYTRNTKEQIRELNLNLNNVPNNEPFPLNRFISVYFRAEHLDDYKCDKCSRKGSCRKMCIEEAPNVLIIQLKRFRYNGSKNSVDVSFPSKLDLSHYYSRGKREPLMYNLYGFISHYGSTANSGHYTATFKGYDKKWYAFDDDEIRSTNPKFFDSRKPYLLFYYKENAPPSEQQQFH